MKKETKRYFLVEYCGCKNMHFDTKAELAEMLERVRKYNNRKTAKYICGNITVEKTENGYDAVGHIYNKLTERQTISDLDTFTGSLSEEELIACYADKSKMKEGLVPDINIAYFENKDKDPKDKTQIERRIKYIPVLYI